MLRWFILGMLMVLSAGCQAATAVSPPTNTPIPTNTPFASFDPTDPEVVFGDGLETSPLFQLAQPETLVSVASLADLPGNIAKGAAAPDFEARLTGDERFVLSENQDAPLLIIPTALGCAECVTNLRSLAEVYPEFRGRGLRVLVLDIILGDEPEVWQRFADYLNEPDILWGVVTSPQFAVDYDILSLGTVGSKEEGCESKPLSSHAIEGIKLGLLITAGFLLVFGGTAMVMSAGLRVIAQIMPFMAIIVGILLVVLGIWLLGGKSLPIRIPQPEMDVRARNPKSIFLYGIAYGLASLSCTLPVFLAVVGVSLTVAGVSGVSLMFTAYGLGMAVVLMSVAIGAAMFKGIVAHWFQKMLPYVHTIGALLLIVAGVYLIWYQGRYLPFILSSF